MFQFNERRRHVRRVGEGLIVLIDGRGYSIVDISIAGLSFQTSGHRVGERVALKIARLTDLNDGVEGRITVVDSSDAVTRGQFLPTARLMHYIVGHIAEATGVSPAYFK